MRLYATICLCSVFTELRSATTHTVTALEMQLRPYLTVTPVSAEDFNVTVGLELQDPGKAYPALSTCVARESLGLGTSQTPDQHYREK